MLSKNGKKPISETSNTSQVDTEFRLTSVTAYHEEFKIKEDIIQVLNEETKKVAELDGMKGNSQAKTGESKITPSLISRIGKISRMHDNLFSELTTYFRQRTSHFKTTCLVLEGHQQDQHYRTRVKARLCSISRSYN